jgi:hypothetical protein
MSEEKLEEARDQHWATPIFLSLMSRDTRLSTNEFNSVLPDAAACMRAHAAVRVAWMVALPVLVKIISAVLVALIATERGARVSRETLEAIGYTQLVIFGIYALWMFSTMGSTVRMLVAPKQTLMLESSRICREISNASPNE